MELTMGKKRSAVSSKHDIIREILELQKDPEFRREIKLFIKETAG